MAPAITPEVLAMINDRNRKCESEYLVVLYISHDGQTVSDHNGRIKIQFRFSKPYSYRIPAQFLRDKYRYPSFKRSVTGRMPHGFTDIFARLQWSPEGENIQKTIYFQGYYSPVALESAYFDPVSLGTNIKIVEHALLYFPSGEEALLDDNGKCFMVCDLQHRRQDGENVPFSCRLFAKHRDSTTATSEEPCMLSEGGLNRLVEKDQELQRRNAMRPYSHGGSEEDPVKVY